MVTDFTKSQIDKDRYSQWQERQLEEWESRCYGCGSCCGIAEGDPCEHLVKIRKGKYRCAIYKERLGMRKTKSGRPFKCVLIHSILYMSWVGDRNCGYKRSKGSCEF